jgi:hypothetical protein
LIVAGTSAATAATLPGPAAALLLDAVLEAAELLDPAEELLLLLPQPAIAAADSSETAMEHHFPEMRICAPFRSKSN